MFTDADLTRDGFLGGRLHLWQPRNGYRAATDPVLLAACVPARAGQSVLDLGCGAGAAILCLGTRVAGLHLAGVEVQPAYAALARRNAAENGLLLEVAEGDIATMPAPLRRGFDHVMLNPPYHPGGSTPSPVAARDTANRLTVPLAVWIDAATRRAAPGGTVTMILGSPALPEALAALAPRLGSAALLPLAPRAGRAAPRAILRAVKGGRGRFRLLSALTLHEGAVHSGDGDDATPEIRAVLRDGADLSARFG